MEVTADPALADDQLDQLLREVRRQDRRQAQARKPGHVEEPPRQGGQGGPRVKVPAVVTEVHAGEDDLRVAGGDQRLDLLDHDRNRLAPAPATSERHDAEAAAVLAAVLDLHEGPRVPGSEVPEPDDRERPRREHVAHLDERPGALPGLGQELREGVPVPGPEDDVDAGDRGDRVRIRLRVAPGDDHHGLGVPEDGAPDGLAVRVVRAGGHGAGVDHVHLGRRLERHRPEAAGLQQRLDLRGVVLVQLTAKRRERDGHRGQTLTSIQFAASAGQMSRSQSLTPRRPAGRRRRRRPRPWTSGPWPSGPRRGAPAGMPGCARATAAGTRRPATR